MALASLELERCNGPWINPSKLSIRVDVDIDVTSSTHSDSSNASDRSHIFARASVVNISVPSLPNAINNTSYNYKIIIRHIIPNLLGVVAVYATLLIPGMIITESFISFLGLGVQEPNTSYTVSGNKITFTTNPSSGTTFWGVSLGDTLDIGTPSDKSVTSAKLATTSFSFFIS